MKVFKITLRDKNFKTEYTEYAIEQNPLTCAFGLGRSYANHYNFLELVNIEEEEPEATIARATQALEDLEMQDHLNQSLYDFYQRQLRIAQSNLKNRA